MLEKSALISIAFSLFLLMDPIGNIPLFISILKEFSPRRKRIIIIRELLIALLIIIIFHYIGDWLLQALRVSQATVLISGGIILFLISIKMVFPTGHDAEVTGSPKKEPFIVPLSVPFVAGPAVLAAVMLYSRQETNSLLVIGAIIIAWIVSTIILLGSSLISKLLGWRGIIACERLMGLLLTMIAVQMFLEGLASFASSHHVVVFQ